MRENNFFGGYNWQKWMRIVGKLSVFRPRTPGGLLLHINETGNIVVDKAQKANKETLLMIE